MLSKPILLNNFKRSFQMNVDYLLNESTKNGKFGDKNQFTWIYDKPFKSLTIQEQGHKTDSKFKELEVKGIMDREAKELIDKLESEDYLSWNIIKSIVKKENPLFRIITEGLNEASAVENRTSDKDVADWLNGKGEKPKPGNQ